MDFESYEIIKQLTRIADSLEKLANTDSASTMLQADIDEELEE